MLLSRIVKGIQIYKDSLYMNDFKGFLKRFGDIGKKLGFSDMTSEKNSVFGKHAMPVMYKEK